MPADAPQRLIAGLWCVDVRDPDLVDGTLPTDEEAAVRAHVAGCSWCERFGGRYGALVGQLRTLPRVAMPTVVGERLDEWLARTTDDEERSG
jgi:anti-sigma factor RsiW